MVAPGMTGLITGGEGVVYVSLDSESLPADGVDDGMAIPAQLRILEFWMSFKAVFVDSVFNTSPKILSRQAALSAPARQSFSASMEGNSDEVEDSGSA